MTKETQISFMAGSIILEGLFHKGSGEDAVIVTHPHSLYGGDMYNSVVETGCRVYSDNGFSTLRFNFRGVGASQGSFENGCGEAADVHAAMNYLKSAGVQFIHLVGYSFGARVLAGVEDLPQEVVSEVYLAPPVAFMDFSEVGMRPMLQLVIAGEHDEIGPPGEIQKQIHTWNSVAHLEVISGSDHFFSGTSAKLAEVLDKHISTQSR